MESHLRTAQNITSAVNELVLKFCLLWPLASDRRRSEAFLNQTLSQSHSQVTKDGTPLSSLLRWNMEKHRVPRQEVRQKESLSIWAESRESEHCPEESAVGQQPCEARQLRLPCQRAWP